MTSSFGTLHFLHLSVPAEQTKTKTRIRFPLAGASGRAEGLLRVFSAERVYEARLRLRGGVRRQRSRRLLRGSCESTEDLLPPVCTQQSDIAGRVSFCLFSTCFCSTGSPPPRRCLRLVVGGGGGEGGGGGAGAAAFTARMGPPAGSRVPVGPLCPPRLRRPACLS